MSKRYLHVVPKVLEPRGRTTEPTAPMSTLRRLFEVLAEHQEHDLDRELDAHWADHTIRAALVEHWGVDRLINDMLRGTGLQASDLLAMFGVRRDAAPVWQRSDGDMSEGAQFHPVGVAFFLIQMNRLGFGFHIDDFILDVVRAFPKGALVDQNLHDVVWAYANREPPKGRLVVKAADGVFDREKSDVIFLRNGSALVLECGADGRPLCLVAEPNVPASVRIGAAFARKGVTMHKGRHVEQVAAALQPRITAKKAKTVEKQRQAARA